MRLKIERPTREPAERRDACERLTLDAALRALEEVQENVAGITLLPPPKDATALRGKAQELVRAAISKGELTSESPEDPLHGEHSGWGKPVLEAPGVPREILAADVLDFLAALLGKGDKLVTEEDG